MKRNTLSTLAAALLTWGSAADAKTFVLSYADWTNDYGLNLTLEASRIAGMGNTEWLVPSIAGNVFGNNVRNAPVSNVVIIPGGPAVFGTPSGVWTVTTSFIRSSRAQRPSTIMVSPSMRAASSGTSFTTAVTS